MKEDQFKKSHIIKFCHEKRRDLTYKNPRLNSLDMIFLVLDLVGYGLIFFSYIYL